MSKSAYILQPRGTQFEASSNQFDEDYIAPEKQPNGASTVSRHIFPGCPSEQRKRALCCYTTREQQHLQPVLHSHAPPAPRPGV